MGPFFNLFLFCFQHYGTAQRRPSSHQTYAGSNGNANGRIQHFQDEFESNGILPVGSVTHHHLDTQVTFLILIIQVCQDMLKLIVNQCYKTFTKYLKKYSEAFYFFQKNSLDSSFDEIGVAKKL